MSKPLQICSSRLSRPKNENKKTKKDRKQTKKKKISRVCSLYEEQHKVSVAARGLPLPVLCCSPSSNMNGFKKLFNALHIRSNGMLWLYFHEYGTDLNQ